MSDTDRKLVVSALYMTGLLGLFVGIPAFFAPHGFYDHFPFVRAWVSLLPPYNQHLTTDVGEFQLAFGLAFIWAARHPARALVVPLCLAWSLSQTMHFAYHLAHLDGYPLGDGIAQSLALASAAFTPLVPAWLVRRADG